GLSVRIATPRRVTNFYPWHVRERVRHCRPQPRSARRSKCWQSPPRCRVRCREGRAALRQCQEIVRGVSKLFLWPRGATFWRGGSNLARSKQPKRRTRVPSPDAVPRETSSQTRDSAPALPPLAFAATLFPTAIRDRRRGPGAMANRDAYRVRLSEIMLQQTRVA